MGLQLFKDIKRRKYKVLDKLMSKRHRRANILYLEVIRKWRNTSYILTRGNEKINCKNEMEFRMIEDPDTAGIIQTYITDRKTFRLFHEL